MSALLIQEEFIAYLPSLARVVGGIPEAVTLQAIWFKADKPSGELVMSRADLAGMLGTSQRSLSRYLNALQDLGVLTFEGRTRVGYDKTTKYTVNPAALDALVAKRPLESATNVSQAPTGPAESRGSQAENVPQAPTGVGHIQSANVAHSQSANVAHSPISKNKKNNTSPAAPPTAPTGVLTDDLGFGEFWGKYPATEWKAKTNKSALRGHWFSLTDQQRADTLTALDAYLASVLWSEVTAVPGPKLWLENEPWLEVQYGSLPEPKPDTRIKWTDPSTYRLED